MWILAHGELSGLVHTYGYWPVGGLVALESMGLPVPGETILVATAIVVGSAQNLSIDALVASAAAGAIIGDNLGFWIGREAGFPLLVRYGRYVYITERKVKLGQYLFMQHGGKVVFFGRFIAILRALAALLAGINYMTLRFLIFNATGGVLWASAYGFGGWYLGNEFSRLAGPASIALAVIALAALIIGSLYLHRHIAQLESRAEAALPGPVRRNPVHSDRVQR